MRGGERGWLRALPGTQRCGRCARPAHARSGGHATSGMLPTLPWKLLGWAFIAARGAARRPPPCGARGRERTACVVGVVARTRTRRKLLQRSASAGGGPGLDGARSCRRNAFLACYTLGRRRRRRQAAAAAAARRRRGAAAREWPDCTRWSERQLAMFSYAGLRSLVARDCPSRAGPFPRRSHVGPGLRCGTLAAEPAAFGHQAGAFGAAASMGLADSRRRELSEFESKRDMLSACCDRTGGRRRLI